MKFNASQINNLRSFACFLILTFFTIAPIRAETLSERHARIRASVEAGKADAARAELEDIRNSEPNVFALNNYDYLLARLVDRRDGSTQAAANYQNLVARDSTLAQYALWHLARFARATGNLTLEREQLRQLIALAPASILRNAATIRLAESFFESGDYAAVIQTLRRRFNPSENVAPDREALALVGQALYRSNQQQAARQVFNTLLNSPDSARPDDYALAGVRGLDLLDSNAKTEDAIAAPILSESEHLRRAGIYNFNRDFAGARLHLTAIVEHYPASDGVPDALYQIGRSFYQERRFAEAFNMFEQVLKKYPDSSGARDALGFKAAALLHLKLTDEAIAAYQNLIERFPAAPDPERPYLNIIDVLRDAGRDDEALAWVDKTRARFKAQTADAEALFARARIHQSQKAWAAALADFDELQSFGSFSVRDGVSSGDTKQNEIAFMRGYTLEQLSRIDEAVEVYLSLPDGRNQYYGWRATHRLQTMAQDTLTRAQIAPKVQALLAEARQALTRNQIEPARRASQSALRFAFDEDSARDCLNILRRAYTLLPAYNISDTHLIAAGRFNVRAQNSSELLEPPTHKVLADELLFLGLYDEGAPEYAVAINPVSDTENAAASGDQALTLALLFARGDMANYAMRYAEPLWKRVPPDYLLELAPREAVELLYPAPYKSTLLEATINRKVDPRFVLAIARQESRFQTNAKSSAAARGLLQFIPSTANDIATQLGIKDFDQDELYDYETTLLFGAEYLKNLFRQFPDMPEAVAASYNGGEDNVARWVARARSNEPDRYVSEIGFTQSKDYVYKVLPNYRAYQMLYTDQLQRK